VGIIFAMTSVAFGQASTVTCGISAFGVSTPRATATGHTEPIAAGPGVLGAAGGGDIRVTCQNTSTTTAATPGVVVLTISLGVPITDSTAFPVGAAIRIAATSGDLAGNVGISAVNNSAGTIVIGLGTPTTTQTVNPTTGPTFAANAAGNTTTTFDLLGVLVSVNGKTGAVIASLSASGGVNIGTVPANTAAGATAQVIDTITAGILDPTVAASIPANVSTTLTGGAAVLNSAGSPVGGKNNFTIKITENNIDTFRSAAQFNGGGAGVFPTSASSSTQVVVSLNNIPPGLNISGCTAALTNANSSTAQSAGSPVLSQGNLTAAAPTLTVVFTANTDLTVADTLWISCSNVSLGSATTPLPATPITAQVTLAPTGTPLCSLGVASTTGTSACTGLTNGNIPRYQSLLQPATPIAVVVFPPSQTTMLVTFASVGAGYNTGIAVANTSTDPFTPANGGAAPINGTITFNLYKIDGTSKVYTTTTGSPGQGLSTGGVLNSGSTYLVNLSDLLTASAYGTTFNGYIFITTNFTNAHGAATVYLTSTGDAALSSPTLIMPAVSTAVPRATIDIGAGLGQ
jgi:hypothetical protein